MNIRPMTKEDVDGVWQVEKQCFSHPWSKASFEEEMGLSYAVYVVAEEEGRIVGYGGMHVLVDEGDVTNIATLPDYQRRGIGRAMVEALVEWCKTHGMVRLMLEVRESNLPARKLYESLGFTQDGRRKGYYDGPKEDAILMSRETTENA